MIDDEMHMAIAIAKEHWLKISGKTKVWLLPDPDEQSQPANHASQIEQGQILEHGEYRFIYMVDHDELFIGRTDEDF